MSNISKPDPETIDLTQLDDITGGCAVGGCYAGGRCGIGGVAYTQRTGFGIDPLFMLFALSLFSQSGNNT